jgi:hypothetical protein
MKNKPLFNNDEITRKEAANQLRHARKSPIHTFRVIRFLEGQNKYYWQLNDATLPVNPSVGELMAMSRINTIITYLPV